MCIQFVQIQSTSSMCFWTYVWRYICQAWNCQYIFSVNEYFTSVCNVTIILFHFLFKKCSLRMYTVTYSCISIHRKVHKTGIVWNRYKHIISLTFCSYSIGDQVSWWNMQHSCIILAATFKYQHGDRLSWLLFVMVFISPFQQTYGWYFKLRQCWVLPYSL